MANSRNLQVAVLGSGYWGKNLVRVFHQLGVLRMVCDTRPSVLAEARDAYAVEAVNCVDRVLEDREINAVAIATPAATHFEIAKTCLAAQKDVYVEKPLSLRAKEGEELVEAAQINNRVLMVGHILQYHPAVLKLKELIDAGELGRIQYVYSSRLNLGKLRTEENILWSFAPHDISAILFLLHEFPTSVSCHGGRYVNQRNVDTTLTTCDFDSGVKAHIFVSWLHPFKEQKLAVVGEKMMAVFDDVEKTNKLTIYAHRIDWRERVPVACKADGVVVPLPNAEPLREECAHFLECVHNRQTPRTDGQSALDVLRVLEACERSLSGGGGPVEVRTVEPDVCAHPTAVIDPGSRIGSGTKIWHFSHVMSGSQIGEACNIGQNVVISPGVRIGRNVKIQNNVSVYTGVELEDDVFCGPSMVFTNVINPRSHVVRKDEYRRTLVRQGASIGANATVVCGATLGKYSFVAAGAVVTRDVPDYALMAGVPARQIGWMCNCGVRLEDGDATPHCDSCGRDYRIAKGVCTEVWTVAAPVRRAA